MRKLISLPDLLLVRMRLSQRIISQARRLYKGCFVNGELNESRLLKLVDQLVRRRQRASLQLIYAIYHFVRLEEARRTAKVMTASKIDEATKNEFRLLLQRRFPGIKRIEFAVIPELIGGVRIRVGSQVIDASVCGQLEALAEQL